MQFNHQQQLLLKQFLPFLRQITSESCCFKRQDVYRIVVLRPPWQIFCYQYFWIVGYNISKKHTNKPMQSSFGLLIQCKIIKNLLFINAFWQKNNKTMYKSIPSPSPVTSTCMPLYHLSLIQYPITTCV